MKLFNKTAIALVLSLLGAASSVSALAMATDNTVRQEVEVKIDENSNENMNVFVSVDGEITTVDVSPSAMKSPEELRELLVDVPENIREKLIESLLSEKIHNNNLKMVIDGEGDIHQELYWLSNAEKLVDHNIEVTGENRVIVRAFDDNNSGINVAQKVIKHMKHRSVEPSHLRNFQVIHQGNMSADSIMRMIKRSDFTADELNEIQQALDAKR